MQTQVKTPPMPSATSVGGGLLHHKCTYSCSPAPGRECQVYRKKRLGSEHRVSDGIEPLQAPPIVHEVLSSAGKPLDEATRRSMEPRFGHDFSRVRVHTDARAAESARAVNALAYTVGHNVVFDTGKYAPGTTVGDTLLAHELTHTVQQRLPLGFSPGTLKLTYPEESVEQEANQAVSAIWAGQPPYVSSEPVTRLARQPVDYKSKFNELNGLAMKELLERIDTLQREQLDDLRKHSGEAAHLGTGQRRLQIAMDAVWYSNFQRTALAEIQPVLQAQMDEAIPWPDQRSEIMRVLNRRRLGGPDKIASDVETLVRSERDKKGALEKLDSLDMDVLLVVVEKLYSGGSSAFGLLNDIISGPPNDQTKDLKNIAHLRAAFYTAPARKELRNPKPGDPGTKPTLSEHFKTPGPTAHPGDWGEDPGDNTWVAHIKGIRTYFGTAIPGDFRTSTWLGNNPGNFDYVKSLTKRAIGSFHWGKGAHDFATYLSTADASADLRDRVRDSKSSTIEDYVKKHLDERRDKLATYIENMQTVVKVNPKDLTVNWTSNDTKWGQLFEGFRTAEGWREGMTLYWGAKGWTDGTKSGADLDVPVPSNPKNAQIIAYYRTLLGVPTAS